MTEIIQSPTGCRKLTGCCPGVQIPKILSATWGQIPSFTPGGCNCAQNQVSSTFIESDDVSVSTGITYCGRTYSADLACANGFWVGRLTAGCMGGGGIVTPANGGCYTTSCVTHSLRNMCGSTLLSRATTRANGAALPAHLPLF